MALGNQTPWWWQRLEENIQNGWLVQHDRTATEPQISTKQATYSNRRPNQVPFHSTTGNWGYNSNKTYQTCFEEFWFLLLHLDQNLVNKGLLTVTVSKHNTGVLPSQLQSHPLQIAFGCSLLDKLAHLWFTTNHKCNTVENGGSNFCSFTAMWRKYFCMFANEQEKNEN